MPPPPYTSTMPISPRHLRKSKTINARRRGCCVQGGLGYSGSGVEILNPSQGEGGRLATLTQGWGLASLLLRDPSLGSHLFPRREEVRPPTYIPLCVYPGSHPTGQEALPHAADGCMTPFPCVVYRVWAGPLIGPGCQPIRCSMVVKVTPCCSEGRVAELLRPSLVLSSG